MKFSLYSVNIVFNFPVKLFKFFLFVRGHSSDFFSNIVPAEIIPKHRFIFYFIFWCKICLLIYTVDSRYLEF